MSKENTVEVCTLPQEGFIRLPMVMKLIGVSRSNVYNRVNAGKLSILAL